jgi:hypothetical protein
VNNFIYDPQRRAVHYNLMALEWGDKPYQVGQMSAVGNVYRGGPSTLPRVPFLMLGGDGDLEYYGKDNIAVDQHGEPLPLFGRYGNTKARLIEKDKPVAWWEGLDILPAAKLETHILANVGARPWDRDEHDVRVLFFIAEGRGKVIDDEKEVGGFPNHPMKTAPFVEADWDLETMEPKNGIYPGQKVAGKK